jgi:hypothetical protein
VATTSYKELRFAISFRVIESKGDATMAKFLSGIAIALALSTLSLAQNSAASRTNNKANNAAQSASPAPSQTTTPRIAPGSVIPVQLTTTVDAKKAKSGEEVMARVTEDLKANNGMMLMPKNTEIVGHITEAQARNKQEKESQVGIVFDHAVTQNGNVSYPLSIQAVISPQVFQNPNANDAGNTASPPPTSPSSMPSQMPGSAAGRGMGSGQSAPANVPPNAAPSETGSENQSSGNRPPAITGHTQGVVGFSHLKLETPSSPTQPSVISSEKNNVKLQNGTLMLLRVNQ